MRSENEVRRPWKGGVTPVGCFSCEIGRIACGRGPSSIGFGRSQFVQVFGRRNNETLGALSEPASKKRQGTKSRGVGRRLGGERYGDLMLAPSSLAGARLGRGDLHACAQRRARE
jgi:hypothetical protein